MEEQDFDPDWEFEDKEDFQQFDSDWTLEDEEDFQQFIRDCERANPGSMGYDYDDHII